MVDPPTTTMPWIAQLTTVLDTFEDPAAVIATDGSVLVGNRAWHVHGFTDPAFADGDPLPVASVVSGERAYRAGSGRRPCGDGWRWYRSRVRALDGWDGAAAVLTHRDITDERRLQMRMYHSPVAHLELDASGSLLNVNERWEELRGRPVGAELGDRWLRDTPEDQRAELARSLQAGQAFEMDVATAGHDDRRLIVTMDFQPLLDGCELIGWQVSATDRTEVRALESAAEHALEDTVTGLANRSLFETTLARKLAGRHEHEIVILFVDLDGFKGVNDTYGHRAGDLVLREVAQRLAGVLRPDDLIARYGGDEFAVMLEGVDDTLAAEIATRLTAAGDRPIEVDEHQISVGVSVGVAGSRAGEDLHTVVARADRAMYRAKRAGGRQVATAES